MKALVLAAGLGTRLMPFTRIKPKPLFTINDRPVLDIIIHDLQDAGFKEVMVNTHHLALQVESFIASRKYRIPVQTRYEPEILGTGGAIKNVADFWGTKPFLVVNSDIVTDIDFGSVYAYHQSHSDPVTLVLYNCPEFNTVSVNPDGFVTGFPSDTQAPCDRLTFTGIQVIDPVVLEYIPEGQFSTSIETYNRLIADGLNIRAHVPDNRYWTDIGTPERYQAVVYEKMTHNAFHHVLARDFGGKIICSPLPGDGSDRKWYRLCSQKHTLVLVDHGIKRHFGVSETDSFIAIGRHLFQQGVPVPEIHMADSFSGIVIVEDLGDIHLQSLVENNPDDDETDRIYRSIIDLLIDMSIRGFVHFNPNWAYQSARYDKAIIIDKECRYFMEAFLRRYMNRPVAYELLARDFDTLAENALHFGIMGFMHRDLQSRNIMVKDGQFYFIDFQAARIGPVQYDLAALLIDPYASLPPDLQDRLLDYAAKRYEARTGVSEARFSKGYRYCALTRNLQMLGAYGFLTSVKKKTSFAAYIPNAIETLKRNLIRFHRQEFPNLSRLVDEIRLNPHL